MIILMFCVEKNMIFYTKELFMLIQLTEPEYCLKERVIFHCFKFFAVSKEKANYSFLF